MLWDLRSFKLILIKDTPEKGMKIGIIRFSSIGDIILCTPIFRWLKDNIADVEVVFLTKKGFTDLLKGNPNIDRILAWDDPQCRQDWKNENFDFIIDLHNNLRSRRATFDHWFVPISRLKKQNLRKTLMVLFKNTKLLECSPITERIMQTVKSLGDVSSYNSTLDFFNLSQPKNIEFPMEYGVIVLGGSFKTKQIPSEKVVDIINKVDNKWVLIGGPQDKNIAASVVENCNVGNSIMNLVGEISIPESAYCIQKSNITITSDTGMYHIAVALGKPVAVFWGNTVPEMGMVAPNKELGKMVHMEVENLSCRPCSKLGFDKCPKGHFRCMMDQNIDSLFKEIEKIL